MTSQEIKNKKEKALSFFVNRLVAEKGRNIEKIMLFGSVAWGKPDKYSDIDLLIFSRAPEEIEDRVDELSFETMMRFGESIEPIIYQASQLTRPQSYLPWLVTQKQTGREIYSTV